MGKLIDGGLGTIVLFQGSGKNPYKLKNHGGHFSCDCPAWRNQGQSSPDKRTCKHLKVENGLAFEDTRLGVLLQESAPLKSSVTATALSSSKGNCLLAHSWDNTQDLTGWWLSEKLDGVRALWDGKKFWSRENAVTKRSNVFNAPQWFLDQMPEIPLDGELTCGRGMFQETISIVRTMTPDDRWKRIQFQVFDAPKVDGTFETRMSVLRTHSLSFPDFVQMLPSHECEGNEHLRKYLADIETLGGEGVMARMPGSHYEIGRSGSLLKVKTFFDTEAQVTGHFPGKGKYKGMTGGLECIINQPTTLQAGGKKAILAAGTRFEIGSGLTDNNRRSPPIVGAMITFRFQETTKDGIPRFPAFVGERNYE